MATLIMGVLMTAAVRTLGSAGLARALTSGRASGRALADVLMAEIVAQAYKDPGPAPVFGREATEIVVSPRTGFNDVDDYDGLTESPPLAPDGAAIPGAANLKRKTKVDWVPLSNLTANSVTETGAKRITVTVTRNGAVVAKRVALRTSAGG